MSIREPVTEFTCDFQHCDRRAISDYREYAQPSVPEGWWLLANHEQPVAPRVFCSLTCLWTAVGEQIGTVAQR